MLYDKLNNQLKSAMKDKNEEVKNMVRNVKSKISEYLVLNKLPHDKASDEVVITVISSHKKQLEKGIKLLEKGGNRSENLIREYQNEIKLCEDYIPEEDFGDIENIVNIAITELGKNNIGKLMGHIMKNNKGIDGRIVKELISKKVGG